MLAQMTGRRVYLDTNVFIYFFNRHPDFSPIISPIFEAINAGNIFGYTGDAAVAEVLVKPYQTNNLELATSFKTFFKTEKFLSVCAHDADTFDLAAQFRAQKGLKFIDALHYATAVRAGCQFFVTNDLGIVSSDAMQVVSLKKLIAEPTTPPASAPSKTHH